MLERRRLLIQGAVQGVGFRPFIYRLANEIGVRGWVSNSAQGVVIEAEASSPQLDTFVTQIDVQKPPHSFVRQMATAMIPAVGDATFEIRHSDEGGEHTAIILPDLAVCLDCLHEMHDPSNRRYRYPFTNCTHCGPRYSIIERLPYDRPHTTMKSFVMCEACRAEYENPLDRRFHAQPIACPTCGPQLSLWEQSGNVLAAGDTALQVAAEAIRSGTIVALKGLGGFQLLVDARQGCAVRRLRVRKQRPDKPFAVMMPSLDEVYNYCEVSELAARLLASSEAPIVLLRRTRLTSQLCVEVAPDNPNLGVMLPYTPLHHLLLETLNFPIIATSGNLASEPLCTDEREALDRLSAIADFFLVHDRPITHPVDDSVVRVIAGTPVMLRRARGYAPLPIELLTSAPSVIATGAHLKNTVALSVGQQAFVSQHIGDLEASETLTAFERTLSDLQMLYQQPADQLGAVACDLHPDYRSTQAAHMIATQARKPLIRIQHHYAHVLACMTEHHLTAPALGVVWDGTGYGTDGTIWGGEFLRITDDSFERAAYLRPFRLAGGDQAVREPRRSALGLLHTMYGEQLTALPQLGFSRPELAILKQTLAKRINAPLCSSMGRFFDAAAALLGLRQRVSFEGQAAMELEFACGDSATETSYPFNFTSPSIDWTPIIEHVLSDLRTGIATNEIAARFHNTLTEIIMAVAVRCQLENVVLTGGCFQNKRLLEKSVQSLQEAGFRPHWSQQFPPNDGSIALGQIAAAVRATQAPPQEKTSCV